jgi:hypothetical protein
MPSHIHPSPPLQTRWSVTFSRRGPWPVDTPTSPTTSSRSGLRPGAPRAGTRARPTSPSRSSTTSRRGERPPSSALLRSTSSRSGRWTTRAGGAASSGTTSRSTSPGTCGSHAPSRGPWQRLLLLPAPGGTPLRRGGIPPHRRPHLPQLRGAQVLLREVQALR